MIVTATKSLIQRTPDVVGGRARIRNTRIAVWLMEAYRRDGVSIDKLRYLYPQLSVEEIEAAFEYAATHRDEIDFDIAQQEQAMNDPDSVT